MQDDWLAWIGSLDVSLKDIKGRVDLACGQAGKRFADDLFADAVLHLFLEWLDNPSKFGTRKHLLGHTWWFARHEMIRRSRRASRERPLLTDESDHPTEVTSSYEGPSTQQILAALESEPRVREVIELRLKELSPTEIAEKLGISVYKVYRSIRRAQEILMEKFRDELGPLGS